MANVDERIFYMMCMYLSVNKFMYTKWLILDESHISCKLFSNCEKELLDNVHYYFSTVATLLLLLLGVAAFALLLLLLLLPWWWWCQYYWCKLCIIICRKFCAMTNFGLIT